MRPRVFPAEDAGSSRQGCEPERRFNEAAGIPRGRQPVGAQPERRGVGASMRPRVFPAEDVCPSVGWHLGHSLQ